MNWPIFVVVFCSILGSIGSLFLKLSTRNLSFHPKKLLTNKFLILGGLLYVVASIIFVWALSASQLSILYPIVALSYIWTLLLAHKYLNEKISTNKWIGVIFIIIGVVLITTL